MFVKALYNHETSLKADIKKLQEQLAQSQEELLEIRYRHSSDKKELNTIKGQARHLEELVDDKSKKITQ